jgi:2'-5' RNA ligase
VSETKTQAMIALLPTSTDWCKIDLPHLTVVYIGEITDRKPTEFNELAKDASSIAVLAKPLTLNVIGLDVFGDEERVDVLRLHASSELLAMREMAKSWDDSSWPDFKPHVTVGPQGSFSGEVPKFLHFDRLLVAWGEDSLTFKLRV